MPVDAVSTAATPAPSAASATNSAQQAQNPLTPLYSIINENDTNFGVGPLRGTQNVLLVEPVIPIRLTPNFNLVTRCSGRDARFIARPPHRTVRAAFPHTAPTLGV